MPFDKILTREDKLERHKLYSRYLREPTKENLKNLINHREKLRGKIKREKTRRKIEKWR